MDRYVYLSINENDVYVYKSSGACWTGELHLMAFTSLIFNNKKKHGVLVDEFVAESL